MGRLGGREGCRGRIGRDDMMIDDVWEKLHSALKEVLALALE